jgi:hypothetical protein
MGQYGLGHNSYILRPRGQQEVKEDNSVAILNRLGQDGWEALGGETDYFQNRTSERTFWLKRPLSTGS